MKFTDLYLEYNWDEEGLYTTEMTGWTNFQPVLAEIEDYDEVRKRLKYEMDFHRRPHMVERLLQKYNKLRSVEVMEVWNAVRYKGNTPRDEYRKRY